LRREKNFCANEKEFSRLRDQLSRQRRELPWEKVEKPYLFDGPRGKETLFDWFAGRSQLLVYHFLLGPGWEQGCPSCSYRADTFDGCAIHLAHRDVTFLVIARATLPEIEAFRKRMGWKFTWVSSNGNDFNFDYHVSCTPEQRRKKGEVYYHYEMTEFSSEELPGASVFYKHKAGEIFHTYSIYARGLDPMVATYQWLNLVPKGRDEAGLAYGVGSPS
jgi:predicted dithiol-disulfide oxidoreductase (DUF899 family)